MTGDDNLKWAELAARIANRGGEVLQQYFHNVDKTTISSKGVSDWVSAADRASEDEILKQLSIEVPNHDVLTEESGIHVKGEPNRYRWIIDPLDGTTNFIRGFPWWAVSVALEERADMTQPWGRIIAGAIAIPATGETFMAGLGCGAYNNGNLLDIGSGHEFKECLIGTGFPFRARTLTAQYLDMFREFMESCADIRRPGAVAIDLCYTAAGIFDGFWEFDLAPWDIAAGSLIITETGGCVGDFQGHGSFLSSGDITAGNPRIYDNITDITRRHMPTARQIEKAPGYGVN